MAAETERKKKNKENLTKRNYDLFVTHILTGTGRSPIVVFVHVRKHGEKNQNFVKSPPKFVFFRVHSDSNVSNVSQDSV